MLTVPGLLAPNWERKKKSKLETTLAVGCDNVPGEGAEWNVAGQRGIRILEVLSLIRYDRDGRMPKLLAQAKPQEN